MNSARTQRRDRSIGVLEALEGRRMLAGNVTAVYDPTTATVVVKGDNKSNSILIAPGSGSAYTITGLDGTKVNGVASTNVIVPNVSNFAIDMGNGDDLVVLAGYRTNNTAIITGNGDDTVIVDSSEIDGNLSIDTGNGNDAAAVSNMFFIAGNLTINAGNGDDEVGLSNSPIFGNMNVDTGNGADSVYIGSTVSGVEVFGNTNITGGNGHDELSFIADLHTHGTQTITGIEDIS